MIRNKSTQGRSERRELIWSNKPRPPRPSYLWRRCWAAVPPCAGSTAGRPGWRSLSSSGSWWWAGWWRPCPAGWWWRPAAAASWPARKTRSSPFPAATAPRPATSPSSEPAAWKQTQCETRGADGDGHDVQNVSWWRFCWTSCVSGARNLESTSANTKQDSK